MNDEKIRRLPTIFMKVIKNPKTSLVSLEVPRICLKNKIIEIKEIEIKDNMCFIYFEEKGENNKNE